MKNKAGRETEVFLLLWLVGRFLVLSFKPGALYMLDACSTTELHPSSTRKTTVTSLRKGNICTKSYMKWACAHRTERAFLVEGMNPTQSRNMLGSIQESKKKKKSQGSQAAQNL